MSTEATYALLGQRSKLTSFMLLYVHRSHTCLIRARVQAHHFCLEDVERPELRRDGGQRSVKTAVVGRQAVHQVLQVTLGHQVGQPMLVLVLSHDGVQHRQRQHLDSRGRQGAIR